MKGISFSHDGFRFVTSGNDKIINLYDYQKVIEAQGSQDKGAQSEPMNKFFSQSQINNVDHCWKSDQFASSGEFVQIWNYNRSKPVHKFEWGADTILKVKYNYSEENLIASTGIDRSLVIYDLRGETPLQKIFLLNKCNALCWNPTEPVNLTVGCDDANCYTFDIRKLDKAKFIHKDHIGAVMDIDYAPTGREFVSGSYDKTVRLFEVQTGKSREVYHGKRMQQIFSVLWSMDNEYVLSGSDDMNIRIWKAQASKPIGIMPKRQENAFNYNNALKAKFKHVAEIKRIQKHRHLPKYILNAKKKKQEQKESKFRKQENQQFNNAKIWKKPKPEREVKIDKIEE